LKKAASFHPIGYAALALPLAFAGLPLYVHLPQYYALEHGISLQALGVLLLLVRLVDTVQDPIIGWLSDAYPSRKKWMLPAMPVLALSFFMLFSFPGDGMSAEWWLAGWLLLTYTAFSILHINYYALGADIGNGEKEHTRIAAWREGIVLVGILMAAVLPDILKQSVGSRLSFSYFAVIFAGLLAIGGVVTLRKSPAVKPQASAKNVKFFESFKQLLAIPSVRWVLLFFFFNTLSASATSTLYLFFIADVIGAEEQSGALLGMYFLAGALGMPLWAKLAQKISRPHAMMCALAISVACFVGAFWLGQGDLNWFYLIAILTGLALGADMALPVAMMAEALKEEKQPASVGFGVWNFISKGNLALAAGIALPMVAMFGYVPGAENTPEAVLGLKAGYALFPCAIKLVAGAILWYGFIRNGRKI
jgi:GPH family glycoside/pentoside/hexuronide:cation symporter